MSECVFGEERLSVRLGVGRELLKQFRDDNLMEDADWGMVGGCVAYSEQAVRMLMEHLGVKMRDKRPVRKGDATLQAILDEARLQAPEQAEPPKKKAAPVDQNLVVAATTKNPQIVLATFAEEALRPVGEEYQGDAAGIVRVRVRQAVNFVPGMRMPCRHLQRDLWELVGRCPRFRGRW